MVAGVFVWVCKLMHVSQRVCVCSDKKKLRAYFLNRQ